MKTELARVKDDMETIQKILGLPPSFRQEWLHWMERDKWLGLWWCVPGVIIIVSALLPFSRTGKHLGLVPDQWAGILVALSLLGIGINCSRRAANTAGQREGMVRELKRHHGLGGQGFWFGVVLMAEFLVLLLWSKQHQLPFEPFWTGLFILWGFSCLVAAMASKNWMLLGYAVPFLGYGFTRPLLAGDPTAKSLLFGLMFVGIALSFSIIQVLEIRNARRQHASN